MAPPPHIVRIGVDVEQELHHRFRMVVPWGSRSEVYRYIVQMITEAIEEGGPAMLGAVLSQKVKLTLDTPQVKMVTESRMVKDEK